MSSLLVICKGNIFKVWRKRVEQRRRQAKLIGGGGGCLVRYVGKGMVWISKWQVNKKSRKKMVQGMWVGSATIESRVRKRKTIKKW
jgi:hypothetical protein